MGGSSSHQPLAIGGGPGHPRWFGRLPGSPVSTHGLCRLPVPNRTTAVREPRHIGRAGSPRAAAGWLAATDPEQACILPLLEILFYKSYQENTVSDARESAGIERIAAIELHEVY